ncbi:MULTISPECIES: trans-aconitate 2-methyltransferase [unclassified Streptomyces]|uniref:trans-aconitate 2-methyltransferase n=1 Tax=unclassified Streptomyces TaxID=2593676 RepID=UPI002DDB2664|nr:MULTISPECIES: trans-aconitate 2-methyltransferase [unclassified Streptomyces]WSA94237.1 trans-aconitate 2-methyltransferase [Streptomyces sp. NBC_01795]WSS13142.1 trans-aconitate 2-methyltransferase [Streptomyces sp. NBC_01186]WSS41924.1 trans-aconitate 2-methyltransferase [Streptomyces sp. NBC_01187]
MWDPQQYLRHAGHRLRPVLDLLAHVPDELPRPPKAPAAVPRIADLGCGPGGPSAPLAVRWPDAHITGYDNSPAMLAEARPHAREGGPAGEGRLDFAHADLAGWQPDPGDGFGLLFSNAALQWVPGHTAAFPGWIDALPTGGALAFQVPGNFASPSHALLAELCDTPRWRDRVQAPHRTGAVLDPAGYADVLRPLGPHGCDVDTWETTYLHLLTGPAPVLDWTKGTTLRPVLARLEDDPEARDAFLAEYAELLRDAYPPAADGTTAFPFRRVFVVAVKR